MKIVQVCPRYYPDIGGVETHVKEISERLVKREFEVEVVCTDPSGKHPKEELINGVKVRRFRSVAPSDAYFFAPQIYFYLKKAKCDVIHAHNYRALPMLFAALAARKSKAKFVITTHLGFSKIGKLPYYIYNPVFGNMIFKSSDKIVVVSPAELDEIPQLKKYNSKVIWIPNGIDFPKYEGVSQDVKNKEIFNLLYVGRLERQKGIDTAIRIIHRLRNYPVHLNIVGTGPYRQNLEKLTSKLNINKFVSFEGKIEEEDLIKFYNKSHTFLLLSEYEAHSMALTEAMGFGLVPIVSNVGGNPYIVNNDKTGFLVDYPTNEEYVANLITKLFEEKSFLMEISKNTKSEALSKYDINEIVNKYILLYKELKP